jgi:L-threonylcarbamoyladenylate synthase
MKENDETVMLNEDIRKACKVLQEGGLILYPTDTVWGLGCDATNEESVRRIYKLKRRNDRQAMLVLIDNGARLDIYMDVVPDVARSLIDVTNKPLTIVYPNARNVAANLLGEDGSLGIRITNELFSNGLCGLFGKPVVSTSANISGEKAPVLFCDISDAIRKGVDYVVRYRRDETVKYRPSGIIKVGVDDEVKIIRK